MAMKEIDERLVGAIDGDYIYECTVRCHARTHRPMGSQHED